MQEVSLESKIISKPGESQVSFKGKKEDSEYAVDVTLFLALTEDLSQFTGKYTLKYPNETNPLLSVKRGTITGKMDSTDQKVINLNPAGYAKIQNWSLVVRDSNS